MLMERWIVKQVDGVVPSLNALAVSRRKLFLGAHYHQAMARHHLHRQSLLWHSSDDDDDDDGQDMLVSSS